MKASFSHCYIHSFHPGNKSFQLDVNSMEFVPKSQYLWIELFVQVVKQSQLHSCGHNFQLEKRCENVDSPYSTSNYVLEKFMWTSKCLVWQFESYVKTTQCIMCFYINQTLQHCHRFALVCYALYQKESCLKRKCLPVVYESSDNTISNFLCLCTFLTSQCLPSGILTSSVYVSRHCLPRVWLSSDTAFQKISVCENKHTSGSRRRIVSQMAIF